MKFYRSESGLYLPVPDRQKSETGRKAKGSSIAVFVEMRELKGVKVEEEDWIKDLNQLEFTDVILTACKVNQLLYRHGQLDPMSQVKLSTELLEPDLLEHLKKVQNEFSASQDDHTACRPVFMHLQCLNLMKLSYLRHERNSNRRINPPEDMSSLQSFGELLLSVSDFLTPSNHKGDKDSYLPAAMEFLRNSLFINTPNFEKTFARYYKLLFVLPEKCAPGNFDGQTLAQLFQKATGSQLDKFFSIGFGLMSQAAAIDLFANSTEPNKEFILEPETYLSESVVEKEGWNPIIEQYALPSLEMSKRVKDHYLESHSVYELSVISNYPLLECGSGRYVISHFPFLLDKFTNGVLRSILGYLEAPNDRRREFKRWWGEIFQSYVSNMFEQELLPEFSENLFLSLEFTYQTRNGARKSTDIAVFEKSSGTLHLFEVTTSSLKYDTSAFNDNWTNFQDDLEKIIYAKARQMQSFICQIKAGNLKISTVSGDTIDCSQIRSYVPYVVSLNNFPSLPCIWNGFPGSHIHEFDGIYSGLKRKSLLDSADIAELKLITAEEIEFCCDLQKCGHSFLELLSSWRNAREESTWSFLSFLRRLRVRNKQALDKCDQTRSEEAFSFVLQTLFGEQTR